MKESETDKNGENLYVNILEELISVLILIYPWFSYQLAYSMKPHWNTNSIFIPINGGT